jgi:hypothetical protein
MEISAVNAKRHEALRDRMPKDKKDKKDKKAKTDQPKTKITVENCADFESFPRLTDELREFLRERKGCLYCRELDADHMSRNCPSKKARRDVYSVSKN